MGAQAVLAQYAMVVVVSPTFQTPIFVFSDDKAWSTSAEWTNCVDRCHGAEPLIVGNASQEQASAIREAKILILVSESRDLESWQDDAFTEGLVACHAAGGLIAAVGPVSMLLGSFMLTKAKEVIPGIDLIKQSICHLCSTTADMDLFEDAVAALHRDNFEEIKGYAVLDNGGAAFYQNGEGSRVEAVGKPCVEVSSVPKQGSFGKVIKLRTINVPDPDIVKKLGTNPEERWQFALDMCAKWLVASMGTVIVSTGAGISAESGIPTYRDPGGLWEIYDQMEVSHIKGFARDPLKCWRFELELSQMLKHCLPNEGHLALRKMQSIGIIRNVVTQNVDGLHTAAGNDDVLELH